MVTLEQIKYKINPTLALSNINLCYPPELVHFVMGPNGSGKSTLMNIINGIIRPDEGRVCYNGCNVHNTSFEKLARQRAMLSQHLEVSFPTRVHQVVMLGRTPYFNYNPSLEDEDICREAMSFFDVLKLGEKNYNELSGGEKQRVQFARVCTQIWDNHSPFSKILLSDEPLTFLDVYYQYDFLEKIKTLVLEKNLTFIAVIHDLNIALKYGDSVALLNQGNVVAQGRPKDVLNVENIERTYRLKPVLMNNGDTSVVTF